MEFHDIAILISTGLVAGFLSGYLGIGGGVIVVPVLVYYLQGVVETSEIFLIASTISLGVVFVASMNASIKHIKSENYYKRAIIPVALGAILGPIPGNYICSIISDRSRIFFFALILSILAVRVFFLDTQDDIEEGKRRMPKFRTPDMFIAGLFMGTVSAMTGIGGGSILVPLLAVILHFNLKKAVGLAAIVMVLNAVSSLIGRYFIGSFDEIPMSLFFSILLLISLGTLFTSRMGAHFNIKSKDKSFKKIAGAVYLLVAIQMYIKAF
ncbi:MAG: sulfite exporter TauE/SafE family protein [Candidatus Delongbacteria bacterium]|nr:sulfite exporter TauE/SafE family protein [Candidatus Delongbacteria bacterium]